MQLCCTVWYPPNPPFLLQISLANTSLQLPSGPVNLPSGNSSMGPTKVVRRPLEQVTCFKVRYTHKLNTHCTEVTYDNSRIGHRTKSDKHPKSPISTQVLIIICIYFLKCPSTFNVIISPAVHMPSVSTMKLLSLPPPVW